MDIAAYILTAIGAYLLGSVPSGYLIGRAKGLDVRTMGSGNIGATNAFRVLGKRAGAVVLVIDGLKGFSAAWWLPPLALQFFPGPEREHLALVGGVGAVIGHNYPCWLKFKGGKGIATSAGVVMAWSPIAGCTALAVWALVTMLTKYVSLASIVAALVLPIAVWLSNGSRTMTAVMAALSLLAIYKHKANIQRLARGTENRIGPRKKKDIPTNS